MVGASYDTIWIDIEKNPSCSWANYSHEHNCQFLKTMIQAGKNQWKNVGVYTSEYEWETVMGSLGACADAADVPLWYAHYDQNPSFGDYRKIGGWSSPAMKQYDGNTSMGGCGVDVSYFSSW
jgi:GH25 family lysozyme M1 (1,4-beta-N-acetylmuramidase)